MNTNNTTDPVDDDSTGVLDEAIAIDTTAIGIVGSPATAQVSVILPMSVDDDLADDEVIDGEVDESVVADLVTDPGSRSITSSVDETDLGARPEGDEPTTGAIVISSLPAVPAGSVDDTDGEPVDAEPADEEPIDESDVVPSEDGEPADEEPIGGEPADEEPADEEPIDEEPIDEEPADEEPIAEEPAVLAVDVVPSEDATFADAERADAESPATETRSTDEEPMDPEAAKADSVESMVIEPADVDPMESIDAAPERAELADEKPADVETAEVDARAVESGDADSEHLAPPLVRPTTRRAAAHPEAKEVSRMEDPKRAVTRHAARSTEPNPTPAAKRVGDLSESSRESADLLTSDRLLVPSHAARPEPEGGWSHLVYSLTGGRINLGDGRRARERKALSARIAAPLTGGARFVPVLSRKGGVGKTTITALLGMALADARDDRVIAIDANPDRGTLADRIAHNGRTSSVRDLVKARDRISGYHDVSALVARDSTRLDVLASDDDPRVAEAFGDPAYRQVADVAAHFYSLVLTDTGTGIVHDVMSATLDLADRLVIVSGLSVDEARLASETLTWLETNGHAQRAREAVVVLNQSAPGTPLVRVDELQAHFATRVRSVVRMPYDAQIAAGGPILFAHLQPATRAAARELAALVVEGLRTEASA